jgi:U3 small nucleolar RNA-associated protein 14
MTVKKRANASIMEDFIDKGASVNEINKEGVFKNLRKGKNVLVRIPVRILEELDEAVKQGPWMTRTQWIVSAIYEKLRSDKD